MTDPRPARLAVILPLLLAAGCAETVGVRVLRPAEINLRGIKKLAIGDIAGPGGPEMTGELTSALVGTGRYEVVDRQNLDRLLAEQQLSASSLSDPESAVKAGKLLGASAAVFGTMTRSEYRENPVKKEDYEATNGKTKEYHTLYVRTGVAKVSASFRVTDLSTGKILASRTISEEAPGEAKKDVARGTDPSEAQPDPIDGEALVARARAAVIARFAKAIAPYYENLSLPFEKTGDLPDLERGISLARANDWAGAAGRFRASVASAGALPPKKQAYAHLDLGMALCFGLGEYDAGLAAIRTALSLNDDSDWTRVARLCELRKQDVAGLAAQGVE